MKTKKARTSQRGARGVMAAAADAAIEIGQAAEDLKSSWKHVQRAQKRGSSAMRPAVRAGKKTMKAVRKRVRLTIGSKKRR